MLACYALLFDLLGLRMLGLLDLLGLLLGLLVLLCTLVFPGLLD